jgi:hypothetical protein
MSSSEKGILMFGSTCMKEKGRDEPGRSMTVGRLAQNTKGHSYTYQSEVALATIHMLEDGVSARSRSIWTALLQLPCNKAPKYAFAVLECVYCTISLPVIFVDYTSQGRCTDLGK